jgi:hypothetical protein
VARVVPKPKYFSDRDALNADVRNRLPKFVQLEWFDDRGD